MTEQIVEKGKEYVEEHQIKGIKVRRKAYINEYGVLVQEWDIPADLDNVPFEEIAKKFRRVRRK